MRKSVVLLALGLVLLVVAGGRAQASSYVDIYGTVHEPIQTYYGWVHSYSGPNLEPGADLSYAEMGDVLSLWGADLSNANLSNADFYGALIRGANFSDANFSGADFFSADLRDSNFSGAYLNSATNLSFTLGAAYYDALTDFSDAYSGAFGASPLFDPVVAGWTVVPEPSTGLLVSMGLVGLSIKRRRQTSFSA